MDIGNKIVQLREENQMSQTELAELLDVSSAVPIESNSTTD